MTKSPMFMYVYLDDIAGWLASPSEVPGATRMIDADRVEGALTRACGIIDSKDGTIENLRQELRDERVKRFKAENSKKTSTKTLKKRIFKLEAMIDEYEDEKAHQDFMKRIG